ncbi:MAG: Re/Si-specific NAD(P)(+) transhydrogenase subunit alpha [Planctomycetia bacterium]|nr:Re/Si-specific NAD(P)(+) transhydrogenase subunit alpha [Planctomycetia bacterium]
MKCGVAKETYPGERRVALVPAVLPALAKAGLDCTIESGAGELAGFSDAEYRDRGATIAGSRAEVFAAADVLAQVRTVGANVEAGITDLGLVRKGQAVLGFCDPLTAPEVVLQFAARGATILAMELVPRITRAQSMDALSSMATLAGYKAVLLAAAALPKMFPMMMTAAGTLLPARALVLGAGVAGLQAIASARRLGAVVEAYDVRPDVKDQVQSLGGKFLDLPLDTAGTQDAGGYARALDESFYRRQRELLLGALANQDVVITTAAVPGRKAPVLITADMVEVMPRGSVIVDLAAERGGNCELSRLGETVVTRGVTILGPDNLPSTVPYHASQMYAKNVTSLLAHLVRAGKLELDLEDQITRDTLVARDGQIVNPRVREALGQAAPVPR